MRSMLPAGCFTRIVLDDEPAFEVAQLRSAMQRIQRALGEMEEDMPAEQLEYIAEALLNLAMSRAPYTVAFKREVGAELSYAPPRP